MRSLKIVVLTGDAERLRGALAMAAAQVALGAQAALFLQMDAVSALRDDRSAPRDAAHRAAGLPSLAQLRDEALSLGVDISVCQSGLSLAGLDADTLDPRIAIGGAVSFLQSVGDSDRLLFV